MKRSEVNSGYARLWRVVDGAVKDAFKAHPEFLTTSGKQMRGSITKRVVGAILGYAEQSAWGRLAAETSEAVTQRPHRQHSQCNSNAGARRTTTGAPHTSGEAR